MKKFQLFFICILAFMPKFLKFVFYIKEKGLYLIKKFIIHSLCNIKDIKTVIFKIPC